MPEAGSEAASVWFELIDTLRFRIVDDLDYLAADIFLDAPPHRSRSMKARLGIPAAYFTASLTAGTREALEAIRAELRRVCRRPNAWLSQS